jgi:hypothetical protein
VLSQLLHLDPPLDNSIEEVTDNTETDEDDADNVELEDQRFFEIERPGAPNIPTEATTDPGNPLETASESESTPTPLTPQPDTHSQISGTYLKPYIVSYGNSAGKPISASVPAQDQYSSEVFDDQNIYAPFSSKLEREVACWAKFQSHLSAMAGTELLLIDAGMCIASSNILAS